MPTNEIVAKIMLNGNFPLRRAQKRERERERERERVKNKSNMIFLLLATNTTTPQVVCDYSSLKFLY